MGSLRASGSDVVWSRRTIQVATRERRKGWRNWYRAIAVSTHGIWCGVEGLVNVRRCECQSVSMWALVRFRGCGSKLKHRKSSVLFSVSGYAWDRVLLDCFSAWPHTTPALFNLCSRRLVFKYQYWYFRSWSHTRERKQYTRDFHIIFVWWCLRIRATGQVTCKKPSSSWGVCVSSSAKRGMETGFA